MQNSICALTKVPIECQCHPNEIVLPVHLFLQHQITAPGIRNIKVAALKGLTVPEDTAVPTDEGSKLRQVPG